MADTPGLWARDSISLWVGVSASSDIVPEDT